MNSVEYDTSSLLETYNAKSIEIGSIFTKKNFELQMPFAKLKIQWKITKYKKIKIRMCTWETTEMY